MVSSFGSDKMENLVPNVYITGISFYMDTPKHLLFWKKRSSDNTALHMKAWSDLKALRRI